MLGLIADYAPHLLVQVRDDQMTATGRVGARARTACGATESVQIWTLPMVPPAITACFSVSSRTTRRHLLLQVRDDQMTLNAAYVAAG